MNQPRPTVSPLRVRAIPGHATPLVGRRFVLEQLVQVVDREEALLLWGPPGVGKSRLAHAFASRWCDDRADGDAWVIDLAAADDLNAAMALIAATLVPGARGAASDTIRRFLARTRPSLVVLDHCEHVGESLANAVLTWANPGARIVLTSRVASDQLATFAVPALQEDEALRLLEQRARRVRDSFRINDDVRADVRRLIRAVDALPGALELLAGRLMLLSPAALLARIGTGETPLHNAIVRSWELLEPEDQATLRQLAVFDHGFDLELAEHVVQCEGDLLDRLERLTNHAWLHVRDSGDLRMQILHEPLRFVRSMSVPPEAKSRHIDAMIELGERWDAGIESDEERQCTEALVQNVPNLWAAFQNSNGVQRARLALVLHMALQRSGAMERQDELTREAVELSEQSGDDQLFARALLARARVQRWNGEVGASRESLERSLPIADASTRCSALRNLASAAFSAGDLDETRRWADEALRVALDEGRPDDEVNARNGLGFLLGATGEVDAAREHLERALAVATQPEQPSGLVALVSSSLSSLAVNEQRWFDAERHSTRAIEIYEDLGYQRQLPLERLYRAEARLGAGHFEAALRDIDAADAWARHFAGDTLIVRVLYLRGVSALAQADRSAAIGALEEADARCADLDNARLRHEIRFAQTVARLAVGEADAAAALLETLDDDDDTQWLTDFAHGHSQDGHVAKDSLRQRCIDALCDAPRQLVVDAAGTGFQWSDAERVDLTRRKALRGILDALTTRHGSAPLSIDEVMAAGWPGEIMTAESGNRRVYVTIKRLRDLGLGDALLTVGDGYMLSPHIDVSRVG